MLKRDRTTVGPKKEHFPFSLSIKTLAYLYLAKTKEKFIESLTSSKVLFIFQFLCCFPGFLPHVLVHAFILRTVVSN